MRTRLFSMLSALALLAVGSGCSTQPTASATPAPAAAAADESVRFWAADSLGAICFNRERTTHALVARARAREQGNEAFANAPTNAR
ncbi:MAG: hypothetical protein FJ255_05725 [Phycisphaerae bacterium]|nr:hypothetical protein [Phycisphaerae bacterium]